jgi:hypothetical protein
MTLITFHSFFFLLSDKMHMYYTTELKLCGPFFFVIKQTVIYSDNLSFIKEYWKDVKFYGNTILILIIFRSVCE